MAFFRNLTFFRFPTTLDFSELEKLLPEAQLKPVGPLEMNSRGFISPFGRDEQEALSHRIADFLWLTVGGEDKILPGSVVNDLLARKVAEIEEKEGRRPGGRARKRLKDDLIHELLPRAFVKSSRTDAMLDLQHGYVAVDTSSRKTGENVMSEIRGLLGSFPALPLNAEVAPRSILTGWIAGEPLPEGLSLGEECEMKDPVDGGATVRCSAQELRSDEIDRHLQAGKQVTKLALTLDDHISFVAGEDLVIRKLKFLDGAIDQLEDSDLDGVRAEFDARFAVMSGELRRLFSKLEAAFHLSVAES
ncbi:recombination associated protein RdgC [Xanthomonas sacchari]|nr:recombination-associated protein RdgC [Xanthomonas sacchari]MDQ1090674.1 recombination associated protein RdgC [Xanthomonas sacchari]